MSFDDLTTIGLAVLTLIAAPLLYIWKGVMSRLESLEKQMSDKMSEDSVRTLVNDKIDPLKDDLKEIKTSIDKLINHIIELKK